MVAESREMLNHSLRAVNGCIDVLAYQWTNRTHCIHHRMKELTRRVLNRSSGMLDIVRDVLAG